MSAKGKILFPLFDKGSGTELFEKRQCLYVPRLVNVDSPCTQQESEPHIE